MASELIFWPSEDVMRLALVSPAVTLACLGEEVLGLGTRKNSQAFHRCCPTTHSLYRREVRKELPAEAMGRPISSAFPTPGLRAESEIQCYGAGRAGQTHSSWLSRVVGLTSTDLGQCLKFEL